MKRLSIFLVVALIALAGCGGDDEDTGGGSAGTETSAAPENAETPSGDNTDASAAPGGGNELTLAADASQLAFDKDALEASAGSVTITMDNPSSLPHNVAVKGGGVDEKGDVVGKGEQSTVTADLKAGSYTFYCSVAGHEAAGMKGTLTVN
jgi:plastocyanin